MSKIKRKTEPKFITKYVECDKSDEQVKSEYEFFINFLVKSVMKDNDSVNIK